MKELISLYQNIAPALGRVLIAGLFIMAGFGKLTGFEGTAGFMASVGLPAVSFLLVLVIILQLAGGISLLLGYKTKLMAFLFAGFVILANVFFHLGADQEMFFMKNLMIIGGLLIISTQGTGKYSLDYYLSKK